MAKKYDPNGSLFGRSCMELISVSFPPSYRFSWEKYLLDRFFRVVFVGEGYVYTAIRIWSHKLLHIICLIDMLYWFFLYVSVSLAHSSPIHFLLPALSGADSFSESVIHTVQLKSLQAVSSDSTMSFSKPSQIPALINRVREHGVNH